MSLERQKKHYLDLSLQNQLSLLQQYGSGIAWGEKEKGYLNFVRELRRGESKLRYLNVQEAQEFGLLEGLLRDSQISCVYVFARNRSFQLIEAFQMFNNGHIRPRGFSWVTDKSLQDETPDQTAIRGLKEEIGIDLTSQSNRLRFRRHIVKNDTANTYPGLQSRMLATDFELDLSDEEYLSNRVALPWGDVVYGFKEVQDDKTTYFLYRENK